MCIRDRLFAVTGLDGVRPVDIIGVGCKNEAEMEAVPALVSKVCFDGAVPARTVLGYFKILEEEDPLLGVEWDEALQELHVHVMGTVPVSYTHLVLLPGSSHLPTASGFSHKRCQL